MDPNTRRIHPMNALAVYAESLVAGGRVAVFGDASLGIGARLASLGARSVHLWDPDRSRARAEAERAVDGVTVHAYHAADAPVRLMDAVIVPDLGLFDDAADLVMRVRQTVGDEGVALIAAVNREQASASASGAKAFDYYELVVLVAAQFDAVRMIAQLPFRGVALVTLGDDEESPAVSVDTQLAEGERTPDGFVVVASQRHVPAEPYTLVELPRSAFAEPSAVETAGHVALQRARVQVDALEAQLRDLRAQAIAGDRATRLATELGEALGAQTALSANLEAALDQQSRQVARLEAELDSLRAAAEARQLAAAGLDEMARRVDRAERQVIALEQEILTAAEANAQELARFEEALRERARVTRALEAEVARKDRMVRELVSALDDDSGSAGRVPPGVEDAPTAVTPPPAQAIEGELSEENAHLREQLDALALELARREGEAQGTGWALAELERRLAERPDEPPAAPTTAGDGRLVAALSEVDALRQALAQEHEARVKAESGEALTRAQAEIERQAVLLAQMSHQLDSNGSDEGADAAERLG